jgi:hypothetical protein
MKNKLYISILLFILLTIVALNIYRPIIFNCNTSFLLDIICGLSIVVFAFLLYYVLVLFNVIYGKIPWVLLSALVLIIVSSIIERKQNLLLIKTKGGIITHAIITKKHSSYKSSPTIYFRFIENNKSHNQSEYADDEESYHKLSIGDTILIIYPLNCPKNSFIYKSFPTPQEIERCKDGCLYKDGEIVGEAK